MLNQEMSQEKGSDIVNVCQECRSKEISICHSPEMHTSYNSVIEKKSNGAFLSSQKPHSTNAKSFVNTLPSKPSCFERVENLNNFNSYWKSTQAVGKVINELRNAGRNDVAIQVVLMLLSSLDQIILLEGKQEESGINYLGTVLSSTDATITLANIAPSLLKELYGHGMNRTETVNPTISPLNCSQEVIYHNGLLLLKAKRPRDAFMNFITLLNDQPWNPRLLCRLAESCIIYHEMDIVQVNKRSTESSDFILPPSGGLNLEYAVICLKNALLILNKFEHRIRNDNSKYTKENENENDHFVATEDEPCPRHLIKSTICFTHLALGYAQTRLGEFDRAYRTINEIFRMRHIGRGQKLLAHLLAAEAMLLFDNLGEHCELKMIPSLDSCDDQMDFRSGKPRSLIHFNMAFNLGLRQGLTQATDLVRDLKKPQRTSGGQILRTFLDLSIGMI